MYDLSNKLNEFYNIKVVLPQDERNELYYKKDLNIQRLKDGLIEYNQENNTKYSIEETCTQGSVAMSTIVQNDNNDYDIDVAIVFDKSNLGDKGAQATRNMVANALKRKTKQFNAEPEVKTSCVRVKYADGYHIDFAVFRRSYDEWNKCWVYEHAGADWTIRDLRGLTEWFIEKNKQFDDKLRQVVRLSKMFCKSRSIWKNMPSGLLQTVLCEEKIQTDYDRIDELLYFTMKKIVERLENNTSVGAPVDNGRDLTPRQADIQKMINWKNRLKSKLEDLEVLFKSDCSEEDAIQAWYGFFNHDYWVQNTEENKAISSTLKRSINLFADTEEFIEDKYQLKIQYYCRIGCYISGDGWRDKRLSDFLNPLRHFIPHNFTVRCILINTNCPEPYKILWKVRNVGPEAERRNMIRGQILERGKAINEPTSFYGNHYIECYIVKDNVCVARERIDVPIGRR